jgi:hypothetical protein
VNTSHDRRKLFPLRIHVLDSPDAAQNPLALGILQPRWRLYVFESVPI